MKLLLDECLPKRLKSGFSRYSVFIVPEMGWAGVKNGELLSRVAREFDLFITADQNLSYQQNLVNHEIAVTSSNRLEDLLPLVEYALDIIPDLVCGQVYRIGG